MIDEKRLSEIYEALKRYSRKHSDSGGAFHIYIHDDNSDHDAIAWCTKAAIEERDVDGIELGAMLLELTDEQLEAFNKRLWDEGAT